MTAQRKPDLEPLAPDALYTACDVDCLSFETTADLEPLEELVGQDRAVEAVRFAIGMGHDGYNLFALGPEGTGKASLVRRTLFDKAAQLSAPGDWCYVNNFEEPHRPRALCLPAGRGKELRDGMAQLVDDLQAALPAVFESDEYRSRKNAIEEEFKEKNEGAIADLQQRAQDKGIALIRTPVGLALAPVKDGDVLSPQEFDALSDDEKTMRADALSGLQTELETILRNIPKWEKEQRARIRELDREVTRYAVGHLIKGLKEDWQDQQAVAAYLDAVRDDVIENVADFLPQEQGTQITLIGGTPAQARPSGGAGEAALKRFNVNVIVDNTHPSMDFESDGSGFATHGGKEDYDPPAADDEPDTRHTVDQAPIVYEDHPTQPNLVGRIEHQQQFGTLVTDFNLIKAGGLHRANGGFLVLDARKLLMQPFTWETLKRALRAKHIRIESAAETLGWVSTVTLEPEPIPLDVKVILMGEPWLYYLLTRYDPDFRELFKVAADFDTRMDRDESTAMQYARLIAGLSASESLHPLSRDGVARIVEHGARLADDAEKLTTHMSSIVDLVRESDFWARDAGDDLIERHHVQKAIDAGVYRSDRIRERIQEEIKRGTLRIETDGERIGEINGLAVYQLDHFSFGKPSRISCRVRMGKGDVIDIEREVALGGPIHSKGVMILSSFLSARYSPDTPLSLTANLVFEQSYGGVEGDSASSTELYVLLSALADLPIRQGFAVTGSVDQHGRVQAIGGVNEKIEGFFDICAARGLTGEQGVLIPAANVKHLMLRDDVVQAARDGTFRIFPVETIDEGIEILTGVAAGARDEDGAFPLGTVNRAVENKLKSFSKKARATAAQSPSANGLAKALSVSLKPDQRS